MIKLLGSSQILKKDEEITLTREVVVHYVDGKPVRPKKVEFFLIGNIQPLNGRDLQLVPEADRYKDQYWLFLNNHSFAVRRGLSVEDLPTCLLVNDIVSRLGVNYQVQTVEDWGSYSRARIMRVDTGPYETP